MTPTVTVDPKARSPATRTTSTARPTRVVKRLMARFEGTLEELFAKAAPTHAARRRLRRGRADPPVGADAGHASASSGSTSTTRSCTRPGRAARRPNLEYVVMKAENLPSPTASSRSPTAIEVLEHVPDPEHTVAEMARCASKRAAGLRAARAAVARAEHGPRRVPEGPGQHARPPEPLVQAQLRHSCSAATETSSRRARRSRGRCSLSASAVDPRRDARGGYGRGARILSIGIAATGLVTFAYFSLASHVLDGDERYGRLALLWSVLFVIDVGDLPADRAAALAHDRRRAARAACTASTRCGCRSRSRPGSR